MTVQEWSRALGSSLYEYQRMVCGYTRYKWVDGTILKGPREIQEYNEPKKLRGSSVSIGSFGHHIK